MIRAIKALGFDNLLKASICIFFASTTACTGGSGSVSSGSGSGSGAAGELTDGSVNTGGDNPGGVAPNPNFGGGNNGGGNGGGDNGGGNGGAGGGGGGGGGGIGNSTTVFLNPGNTRETTRDEQAFNVTSDAASRAFLNLALVNTTSFQVVTEANGAAALVTSTLAAPEGTILVDAVTDPLTSLAEVFNLGPNVFPYPARGADAPIGTGTYIQTLFTGQLINNVIEQAPITPITGTVIAKHDSDLTVGRLPVNIFLVGTTVQLQDNRQAVDDAIVIWRQIYAAASITLDIEFIELGGNGVLPNIGDGSDFYATATSAANVRRRALNVFVGETISQDNTQNPGNPLAQVLGISGGIPGSYRSTIRSGVTLSLSEAYGVDANFSQAELEVFGETMAHEAGHYLGLFHPVEISNGGFDGDDPLADTRTCTTIDSCAANGVVSNLMFPSAIGGVSQQNLTADQSEVLNLQVIVD